MCGEGYGKFPLTVSGDFFQTHGPVLRYRATAMRNPEDIPLLFPDPVIEAYLKDVDRTILRANLQLAFKKGRTSAGV